MICLILAFSTSFSLNITSTNSLVSNLKANVTNSNLVLNWDMPSNSVVNYCEVQASKDGKTFSTIGYVMGADPKQGANSFSFRQQIAKLKPGQVFYRVLQVSFDEKAIASEVVKINP